MTDSFKTNMALPGDVVAHKTGEHGKESEAEKMREKLGRGIKSNDDVMLRVKEADQMTGTWFSDPGKMGGEGTGPAGVDRRNMARDEDVADVMLRVKEADQMTGMWFIDPGKMGGEGTSPAGVGGDNKDRGKDN